MKTLAFSGITRSDTERLKQSFGCSSAYYMQGEEIYTYNTINIAYIGVISGGEVNVSYFDEKGNLYYEVILTSGSAFGELFGFPPLSHKIKVFALKDCEVTFFEYNKILRAYKNECYYHTSFLYNIQKMASEQLSDLYFHLSLLKKRNIRDKILFFLEYERQKNKNSSFIISMNQSRLSSYLCIDRSALARELSALRKEGLIKSKGKFFELLF